MYQETANKYLIKYAHKRLIGHFFVEIDFLMKIVKIYLTWCSGMVEFPNGLINFGSRCNFKPNIK